MEYGTIPNMTQFTDNYEVLIQQVQPSNAITKVSNNENENSKAFNDSFKEVNSSSQSNKTLEANETSKSSQVKEVTPQDVAQYQEVVLTNLNFGYNDSSQDFYVKAIRGEAESQFPTDEMMRLKSYFMAQAQAEQAAQLEA